MLLKADGRKDGPEAWVPASAGMTEWILANNLSAERYLSNKGRPWFGAALCRSGKNPEQMGIRYRLRLSLDSRIFLLAS